MSRTLVGEVWVDSGQVMIVDPCYLGNWEDNDAFPDDENEENYELPSFRYSGACRATTDKEKHAGQLDHGSVASTSGFGDGCYPVYAEYSDEGEWGKRVKSLTIEFF